MLWARSGGARPLTSLCSCILLLLSHMYLYMPRSLVPPLLGFCLPKKPQPASPTSSPTKLRLLVRPTVVSIASVQLWLYAVLWGTEPVSKPFQTQQPSQDGAAEVRGRIGSLLVES